MKTFASTLPRRLGWSCLALLLTFCTMIWFSWKTDLATQPLTNGDILMRFLVLPISAAIAVFALLTACASPHTMSAANAATLSATPAGPFMAQVVGLQWLNPLQRRDYPTEWQLLWTLGLVQPNKDDDMVRTDPKGFTTLQAVSAVAAGNKGKETFKGYHHKYVDELFVRFHDIYFSSSTYFYNAHSLKDKSSWRELAGIHVEYALPEGKLDPIEARDFTRQLIADNFEIGNVNAPTLWTRSTPPDVRVTMGGANAGFTSLAAGLDYLQAHPNETVWVMNWDAPSRPKDRQINENMVLLVLAGPNYKTERDALAWIGYPATKKVADFEAAKGTPPRAVQAWKAVLDAATQNAGKRDTDIGYVIHDANNSGPDSSERIGKLAQTLTTELVEFDFMKQTFNTPALLGEMGAGTALTNVALGIAYANHFGKHVLVAGTSDAAQPTGVLVVPPAKVRPIIPGERWFRARGGNHAYLPWWGLRHDAEKYPQGYSD
ncbi:MAG: virulence factor [Pseudomonadota bacterium]